MKQVLTPIFALLTPFDSSGKIDFHALTDYLSFLEEKGVNTILTNGTTGEFPSLSLAERMKILEHSREKFHGTILNHISSCCVSECVQLAQHAKEYAQALVLLPPYYYANSPQQGILNFFRAVLQQVDFPIYLYHFPKHTKNVITLYMLSMLLRDHPHLLGIKDSEAHLENCLQFKTLQGGGFQVFVGGDSVALEVLRRGLDGSVTGGSNPFPELLIAMTRCFQSGDLEGAMIHQASLEMWSAFRKQNNLGEIPLTKIAMRSRISHFPLFVRPPLRELDEDESIKLFIKNKILSLI